MTNLKRKDIAKKYYLSVSNNQILNARMSPRNKGDVCLKVYNPTFKSTGNITIGVRPQFNEILLMSEIGVHGAQKLSDFL